MAVAVLERSQCLDRVTWNDHEVETYDSAASVFSFYPGQTLRGGTHALRHEPPSIHSCVNIDFSMTEEQRVRHADYK